MDSHRNLFTVIACACALPSLLLATEWPTVAAADARAPSAAEPRSGPPDPREPPPFAFEACADKQEGETCSVTLPDRTLEGSGVGSRDDRLFCMPDNMPPPPPGRGGGQGPTL